MTPLDKLFADCTVALLRENNIEPYVGTELASITDLDNLVIDTIKAKQQIKDLMLELIGEDYGADKIGPMTRISQTMATKMIIEDDLKQELRKKVSKL